MGNPVIHAKLCYTIYQYLHVLRYILPIIVGDFQKPQQHPSHERNKEGMQKEVFRKSNTILLDATRCAGYHFDRVSSHPCQI